MARGGARIGFRSGTQQIIEKSLFGILKKNEKSWVLSATRNVKSAIFFFLKPVILTGYTQKTTHVQSFLTKSNLTLRFITPNKGRNGYAVFPLLGLSTSRKYGARNWLKKGAEQTIKDIKKTKTI